MAIVDSITCTIDATGISAPAYQDVLDTLTSRVEGAYGSDIYIDPDSQDGQMVAIFAQAIHDCNQQAIAVYNSQAPSYAQGAGLSARVKINGLKRQVPTNSTVNVTIVGQAGTVINNGVVKDEAGNLWNLPATVTIPFGGTIVATATAQVTGNIAADIGTVDIIYTPTLGWQTVDNDVSAAAPGAPVETDAALRNRQFESVANPGQAIIDSISAAIGNVPVVERFLVYENATGSTDSNGIPAHSISAVVEGGDVSLIADAIASRKPPGIQTYGTTSETVFDERGLSSTINFFVLAEVQMFAMILAKALPNYLSTTGTLAVSAIAISLGELDIGQDSEWSELFPPAKLKGDAALEASAAANAPMVGFTQQQLDALAKTFNVTAIYQSRGDMLVTAGPYAAGVQVVSMSQVAQLNSAGGQMIAIPLDNGALFIASSGGTSGGSVVFTPPIPAGRQILSGAQVYVNGDLTLAFNEAAICSPSNITLTVT